MREVLWRGHIRGANVKTIITENGVAVGVETEDGEKYSAKVAVVSEIEPPTTFGKLLDDSEQLPSDFKRGLRKIKYECAGVTLNVALDAMPDFGFPQECYGGFFGMTPPGYRYAERAFAEYKCGRIPKKLLSMTYMPTYYEEPGTFAPEGHHVLTGYAFPVTGNLWDREWDAEAKAELLENWIDTLNDFTPGLKDHVIYADGFTPKELDEHFVMTNGDLGHGTLRW